MDTFFAKTDRHDSSTIEKQIAFITNNPAINTLCEVSGSLFAVLNDNRQIIALNNALLQQLDIVNESEIFGKRLGEALDCVHSKDNSGGCGTGPFCASCGAAIAMVVCQEKGQQQERFCSLKRINNNTIKELLLRVTAHPFISSNIPFILIFLDDITELNNAVALQNAFIHDIHNSITGLTGTFSFARSGKYSDKTALNIAERFTNKLIAEIDTQRLLLSNTLQNGVINPEWQNIQTILDELGNRIRTHPSAKNKVIDIRSCNSEQKIRTQPAILDRIIYNMAINACEATSEFGSIMIWVESTESTKVFKVWNNSFIPEAIQKRIFEKHFSTKDTIGRGFGTYSMKLLAEKYLGGTVRFESDIGKGTTFILELA